MIDVARSGHRLVREKDFPHPTNDEKGLDAADFVLLLEGKANPDSTFCDVGRFTIFTVFRCKAGSDELGLTVRVVRTRLVCLVQKIGMKRIDGEPLIGLDIVVRIPRYGEGAHDEAK
jgi:hypothetical protein